MQQKVKSISLLGLTAATALFLTAALPQQAAAQFKITANITGPPPERAHPRDIRLNYLLE